MVSNEVYLSNILKCNQIKINLQQNIAFTFFVT